MPVPLKKVLSAAVPEGSLPRSQGTSDSQSGAMDRLPLGPIPDELTVHSVRKEKTSTRPFSKGSNQDLTAIAMMCI